MDIRNKPFLRAVDLTGSFVLAVQRALRLASAIFHWHLPVADITEP